MKFWKSYSAILLITFSALLYIYFAYFLERIQFSLLLSIWVFLFVFSYYLIKNKQLSFTNLIWISILFRFIFLFAIPNLSQDFYRFIWDGRMILEGLNPYLSLPKTFIEQGVYPINQALELYQGMGDLNGSHYTNYPPLNQLCFLIAALFSSKSIFGSVIVMRLIIIFADIGILYFGKKLLEKLQFPIRNIFWYALNPFIIIELTGNLHFESVMLFFLVWSLYKLHQGKWIWSAALLACSISVKLIPLLFLPLFYQWFVKRNVIARESKQSLDNDEMLKHTSTTLSTGDQHDENLSVRGQSKVLGVIRLVIFYTIIIGTSILFFLPFYSSTLIENYTNSVGLWFRNFEFNASFYYVAREIGYLFRGWNEIAIIGKITPVLTIMFLLVLVFFKKNKTTKQLITALLFGLSFYYFTTTTMHPWYLATLILLSIFTKYRFPIIWSLVIILSYQVFETIPWKENLWLISLEYIIVYGFLFWELFGNKTKLQSKQPNLHLHEY